MDDAAFILNCHKDDFTITGPLPDCNHAGKFDPPIIAQTVCLLACYNVFRSQHFTQELHWMAFERKPCRFIVGNDVLGHFHLR